MHEQRSALIRSFIAIPLPTEIRDRIGAYLGELRSVSQAVKWVRAENIHLTLKFFGEIETEKIEKIKTLMPALGKLISPFRLEISGSGCFPNKRKPRVFWLALSQPGTEKLQVIYRWLEDHLAGLGFERETRKFSPHLTLGRVKTQTDFRPLLERMEKSPFPVTAFDVSTLELIRSHLTPAGARYTTLAAVTFQSLKKNDFI
jgi:2'-5' RNA ligase